jgi:phospholipid transport system transporter-binding protein
VGIGLVSQAASAYRLEMRGEGRFALSGVLSLATAASVLMAGERAFADATDIEVDLSGVATADSAGLAVLLEWVRWARLRGRRLRLVAMPPVLTAIADISEVEDVLQAAAG